MKTRFVDPKRIVLATALVLALPLAASAQSQLDAAQASQFMGNWTVAMQTDMGAMSLNMSITNQGGKVAASVGSPDLGGTVNVTDIARNGDALVLRYNIDAQGMMVDVMMSLTPSGNNLSTYIEAAAGAFSTTATATRVAS
jgi:hypothetical protein